MIGNGRKAHAGLAEGTVKPNQPEAEAKGWSEGEPIIEQEYKAEETAADGTLAATVAAFGAEPDRPAQGSTTFSPTHLSSLATSAKTT